MKFSFKQFIVPNFGKRLAFMLPAVILMGVFLSVLIEVNWGTDPASFMNLNIANVTGLSLGTTQVLIYSIMLIFTFIFGAEMIGFGTIANMTLIGYVADFSRWMWQKTGFHDFLQNTGFIGHLIVFVIAIICFVFVAAIYMNAQMGTAPYDAIPAIISKWLPKVPFFVIRMAFDLTAVLVGFLVSRLSETGMQGSIVTTLAMCVLLGPVIQLVGKPLKKIL